MARAKSSPSSSQPTATIGFEATEPVRPDLAADKLRNNLDAAVTERSDTRAGSGLCGRARAASRAR